jgi:hypothetical protein
MLPNRADHRVHFADFQSGSSAKAPMSEVNGGSLSRIDTSRIVILPETTVGWH